MKSIWRFAYLFAFVLASAVVSGQDGKVLLYETNFSRLAPGNFGEFAIFDKSLRLPLQPMIGQIGPVPATGQMDTKTPADTGGNMDCREVRAGSMLVFTAQVKGGLPGVGDPHALQGDGEIGGQGVECDAEDLVRFRKLPEPLSPRPVILRPEFAATIGANKDLSEAAWQATDDMVNLLSRVTGRSEKDARMLVNLTGNLRINQIVDGAKGARMEMPSWALGMQVSKNYTLRHKFMRDWGGQEQA